MIKATFTERGERLSLRLEGHAEYAEHGKDLICASASILAYTVAQYVKIAQEHENLVSPAEIKLESGDAFISCEPNNTITMEARKMFDFAKLGYRLLAHNYPQYVELITDGEAE